MTYRLSLLLLAVAIATQAHAADIVAPRGTVSVIRQGHAASASDGQTLVAGDIVVSQADGGFDIRDGGALTHYAGAASFSYQGDASSAPAAGSFSVARARSIATDPLPGTSVPDYAAVLAALAVLTVVVRRKARRLRRTGGTLSYHFG